MFIYLYMHSPAWQILCNPASCCNTKYIIIIVIVKIFTAKPVDLLTLQDVEKVANDFRLHRTHENAFGAGLDSEAPRGRDVTDRDRRIEEEKSHISSVQ